MPFNLDLLRSPSNWLVIGTMVIIGLFALHYSLALIHHGMPVTKHPSRVQS